jgi:hypothetical protein
MHPLHAVDFGKEAIKVTWCTCERCLAMGPRSVTLVKNGREKTLNLRGDCCLTSNCQAADAWD